MRHFCNLCGITSLNNRPTCYKHPANRSYIDLISTNCPKYFQNITVIETGLSYFHKNFCNPKSKIAHCRNYKNFPKKFFRENLINPLQLLKSVQMIDKFFKICEKILKRHAPRKEKYIRGNQSPFINKY